METLAQLGKIAGIGGIAVGAVVLIIRAIAPRLGAVPVKERAPLYRLVIIGAFGIGALVDGISGQRVHTRTGSSAARRGSQASSVDSDRTVVRGVGLLPAR